MIEIRDLKKIYAAGDAEVRALDGVSLTIAKGEFVAIMGASGSGKSTLMQILGLLDVPSEGSYKLFGREVKNLSEQELAALRSRYFGFVFQQFFLLPKMTALENAALPLLYSGHTGPSEAPKARLTEVGLANRADHRPNEMSGGQQQRVAIARALVNNPDIIFADEPTGNLDSRTKKEIMEQLTALNAQGKTVILVTHEEESARFAKRIITMRDGKILSDTQPTPMEDGAVSIDTTPIHMSKTASLWEYVKQAFFSIASHKTRSFLSVLGILIGVAAVIAMLALGTGANEAIKKSLASLGSNMLMVRPGAPMMGGVSQASGSSTRLTKADVVAIGRLGDFIRATAGSVNGRAQIVANAKNWNTQLEGTEIAYESIRAATPMAGRFFTEEENKGGAKVALIGLTVVRQVFENQDPVGQMIKINNLYFKVIGVLPAKGASGFRDQDDTVVIPLNTAMNRVLGKEYLDMAYVDIVSEKQVDGAIDKIKELIYKRHHLVTQNEKESFDVRNMADIKNALSSMTKTMTMLLGCVAAISLVVGGIGIMNIMLVAVVERTKEIGLRKAIGATRRDIMYQFLFESVLLSIFGGLLGVALGAGISFLLATFAGWAVSVSLSSVLLSVGFSFMVGVVFGLWPAMKASELSPIVALRYE